MSRRCAGTGAASLVPRRFLGGTGSHECCGRWAFTPKHPRQVVPVTGVVSLAGAPQAAAQPGLGPLPGHTTGADPTSRTEKDLIALPKHALPTALLSLIPLSRICSREELPDLWDTAALLSGGCGNSQSRSHNFSSTLQLRCFSSFP